MKGISVAAALSLILVAKATPFHKRSSSVIISIDNNVSNSTLTLIGQELAHGAWNLEEEPQQSIKYYGSFVAAGEGIFAGVEGSTTYALDDGTVFNIQFDFPAVGSDNRLACDISGENAGAYTCTWPAQDVNGWNSNIPITIAEVENQSNLTKRAANRASNVWITTDVQNQVLTLTDSGLSHGEWKSGWEPKKTIRRQEQYTAESNGFLTGDEGWTTYTLDDGTAFKITFNNPQWGSNTYSCTITGQYADQYKCTFPSQSGQGDFGQQMFWISLIDKPRPVVSTISISNPGGNWSLQPISKQMDKGEFITNPGKVTFGAGGNSFQVKSSNDNDGDAGSVTYRMDLPYRTYNNRPATEVTISFSTDASGATNWQCRATKGDAVRCGVYVGNSIKTKDGITSSISFSIYQ